MNIKTFCKEDDIETLCQRLEECNGIAGEILKRFASPDIISSIADIMKEGDFENLSDDAISVSIGFFANALNQEIIRKELFRREMEDDS